MILLHRLTAHNFKQLTDVSLCFPDRGTILIEGANEAGKSSLFEAIFFALYGRGLITDRDFGVTGLRKYGEEELRVELEFSIAGRRFHITRRVGNNHTARLLCPMKDEGTETITSISAIRARLGEELRLNADALLNTCFVEQKDLGRLEDMDGPQRRAAINELLNLRVLTNLEANFKVTTDDQNGVKRCEERLAVARLDAALPALEQAVYFALNCLHYTQLRAAEALWRQLQQDIEAAQTERAEIAARRDVIAAKLEDAARLKRRIHAADSTLTLQVRAWRDAAGHQERAHEEWQALSILVAGLPARLTQQAAWRRLAQNLTLLENLEAEARTLQRELQEQKDIIAAYKQLQSTWEAGFHRQQTLQAEREKRQKAVEEADQRVEARIVMNQRDARIAHLQQQIVTWETAAQEAAELQTRLQQTREEAERLPQRVIRREQLALLEEGEKQAAQDRQEYVRVAREWDELQQKRREGTARQARIAMLESDHAREIHAELEAQEAEQYAADRLRCVQARLALLDWAEAAERAGQVDMSLPRLNDIQTRQEQAQQRLAEREAEQQQIARRGFQSLGILGAGVLMGVAGAVVSVILAGVGIVLALIGAVFCLQAQQRRRAAQLAEGEARRQRDQLEGERQGAQIVLETQAEQAQEWAHRAADCRRRLEQHPITLPESAAAARTQIASLPDMPLSEAQEACRDAEIKTREASNVCNQTAQTLQHERGLAQQVNWSALDAREGELATARDLLSSRLNEAQPLQEMRLALNVSADADALRNVLQTAEREVADSRSAQARLPELQTQQEVKKAKVNRVAQEIREFAAALPLPGQDIAAWKDSAAQERQTTRQAKSHTSDAALQEGGNQARQALVNVERQESMLEGEQARHKTELEKASLPLLEEQAEGIADAIARNAEDQANYKNIRPALQSAELPAASAALNIELAAEDEALRNDQERAQQCSDAERKAEQAAQKTLSHRDETLTVWNTYFTEAPLPDTPEEAARQLPSLRESDARELAALNEPDLRDTDAKLREQDTLLAGDIRTWHQAQTQSQTTQQALREQLEADKNERVCDLPARLPELAQAAEYDAGGWETEIQRHREAARDNRSHRKMRAEAQGIAETTLDANIEKRTLEDAILALEVKRCAGEVVARTRQSIVNRVMPLTEQNMRLLLPLLTEGRYQDVKWEEALNAVVVYDRQAREFQRKRVFSGGAKDQISLALRMAFALATLPGEHNIRPGFLFLDEPLSSFDKSRTRALVDLLTRGLICQKFEQVFLVSHSEAFDPACFEHRLRMEGGRVSECTLG